jgi:hypothetical protein
MPAAPVPGGHAMGAVEFGGQNAVAGHGEVRLYPPGQKDPAKQGAQAVREASGAEPGEHETGIQDCQRALFA